MICDTRLEIRMPAALRTSLEARAAERGWSAAMYAREAIRLQLLSDAPPRREPSK